MITSSRTRLRSSRWATVLLAVSIAASVFAALPAVAHAETYFTFMSRGFGHGLGMSQYGAKGFASAGYSYDYILRYYYGNAGADPKTVVATFTSEPTRDVNLDRDASYASGGNAGFTNSIWTLRPGWAGSALSVSASTGATTSVDGWSTFAAEGDKIRWTQPDGRQFLYSGTISVSGVSGTPRLTQVKEPTGHYDKEYVRFRGELRLTASGGKLKLVNRLAMPEYLYGVVPRESPASWPIEALKAQAVAARGYAWSSTRTELYTDTRDQVYGGHSGGEDRTATEAYEDPRSNAAVDATLGRVVTYDGAIIRTYFMSTSGGYTENNENVWGGTALPYLRGVPDPYETYAGSSRHDWLYQTFTATDVRTKLLSAGASATLVPDPIADIRVVSRGVSGRPTKVEFTSLTGAKTYFDSNSEMLWFRNALGWGDIWFYVDYKTTRLAGTDRYATSVAASRRVFDPVTNPAKAVIVANGNAPADALAASSLAGAVGGAPILLTSAGGLSDGVVAEIERLAVTKVYVVGGTTVVPSAIEEALGDVGDVTSVVRLAGPDRYGTARQIAAEVKRFKPVSDVIVVSGESLADAVAAAGFAYARSIPIVPVRAGAIPPDSAAALSALAPTSSLVIGGTAVVSDVVLGQLPHGRRIVSGADRYESARQLSWYLTAYRGFNFGSAYIASGPSLVDALAIGPVTGYNENPLLFAKPYELPSATRLELTSRAEELWRVHIAGGDAALSGWLQGQIESILE